MCCETCPNYPTCEEEGSLNKLCCGSCPEYRSCYDEDEAGDGEGEDSAELKDELYEG